VDVCHYSICSLRSESSAACDIVPLSEAAPRLRQTLVLCVAGLRLEWYSTDTGVNMGVVIWRGERAMIDINLIRQDPETVRQALLKRMVEVDFSELLSWDAERRALISQGDELRSKRNRVSDQIPAMKRQGVDVSSVLAEMKEVSDRIKEIDSRLAEVEAKIRQFLDSLPNMPDDDVVAGGKENNEVVRVWGEQPGFDFPAKDHMDLAVSLGLVDYERGAKLGGNGFWIYTRLGARCNAHQFSSGSVG
jgi:seryl-tRNA synthetase